MRISPDELVLFQIGPFALNATIVFTWGVMLVMVVLARLVTRRLTTGADPSRGQLLLETLHEGMRRQIREVARRDPGRYLPFVGTLFLFIAVANLLTIVPGYEPPTGSLSTTAALALCVFVAVPLYGITSQGLGGYLKQYAKPSPVMLPFNVIGDLSRTIALAVRLYGNIMSGTIIIGILLGIAPLFFPIVMRALGLLTGLIQAYIFAVLAMVYIASAEEARTQQDGESASSSSSSSSSD